MGINIIGKVPCDIVTYLKLENPESYVGDRGIYPVAITSSGDVAADIGCHHVTQRKRKVAEISKFENSIRAFSNRDAFF